MANDMPSSQQKPADDSEILPSRIPTLTDLHVKLPAEVPALAIAAKWIDSFSAALQSKNVDEILDTIYPSAFWRDLLALTWDFRSFDGEEGAIRKFVTERLVETPMHSLKLREFVQFQKPFPDVAWVLAMFDFETDVGKCLGVVRLIPTSTGEWKAFTIFTLLEELKGFPERVGANRSTEHNLGTWISKRAEEVAFEKSSPSVIVVGGNHAGLEIAARLKYMDVPTLVVDSHPRVGDSWRKRYTALCLHFPIWGEHMPYLPFPVTWPAYTPALKMADWLETYAHSLELNVWNSATVTSAHLNEGTGKWDVAITSDSGWVRHFTVNHVVFAIGVGPRKYPVYPGMNKFGGIAIHSEDYKDSTPFKDKRVFIVGCGNSAHDAAGDLARHGVDVTMFQRHATFVMNLHKGWKFTGAVYSDAGPPVDTADRIAESVPQLLKERGFLQPAFKKAMEQDKELIDGLRKAGFRVNAGIRGTGYVSLLKTYGGGHVFDVGTCKYIIDGKIKLKNDSLIKEFHENGIEFEDGTKIDADVIIYATGNGDRRDVIRQVCGDTVADKCKPIWGMDAEGEVKGAWRDLGVKNLWFITGSLALCRFHSKQLALQIKAAEEGLLGERYSIEA